jgi:putative thiamine transport system ATP-binding protein
MSLVLKSISISRNSMLLFGPLDLAVEPGRIATIMGPSGCGKSTLLAAICGMIDPVFSLAGSIRLNGRLLNDCPMEERRVGILFQDDLLFPHLDVFGNMAFGLPARLNRREKRARVEQSLAAAGLEGFQHRDIATLSGGQKARVSLLRALLAEPEAILLDEPFSKLDETLRDSIRSFVFEQIARLDIPSLLVTHDKDDSADGSYIELR